MEGEWKCQRQSDPAHLPPLLRGQDPQGSSDCTKTAWNTSHPPVAPHPTRSKGAEEGQGARLPLGSSGQRRGFRCPGSLYQLEKVQELCSLGSSPPVTGTQRPPTGLTYLSDRHKEGKKGPPADPLSTLAGVDQPQPCGLLLAGHRGAPPAPRPPATWPRPAVQCGFRPGTPAPPLAPSPSPTASGSFASLAQTFFSPPYICPLGPPLDWFHLPFQAPLLPDHC